MPDKHCSMGLIRGVKDVMNDFTHSLKYKRYSPFQRRCRNCNNLSPHGLFWSEFYWDKSFWVDLAVFDWDTKDDCQFCQFLDRVFRHYFGDSWTPWRFKLYMKPGHPLIITDIEPCSSLQYGDIESIEVFHDIDNDITPWSKTPYIGGGSVHLDHSDDQGVYDFISDCLSDCKTRHRNCKGPDVVPLPKRLLEVSEPNHTCRLIEPSPGQQGTYTALSYCWGKGNPLKLTNEVYNSHKDGISWDKLPRLFQDAMRITNRLGVHHIWIDSLCIIQDSRKDWEIEAEKMASIYQNAHITIVAGSSPNPETPILREREKDMTKAQFDFVEKSGSPSYMFSRLVTLKYMFEIIYVKKISTRQWTEALYQRGWTLQEDLLSKRTIHYLPNRVVWECQMLHRDEHQLPRGQKPLSDASKLTPYTWWEFVEAYTARDLTCASDTLPAMSGIANMLSQKTGDDYLAGLWRNSLITDLGWRFTGLEHGSSPSREYVAPSWSWASIPMGKALGNWMIIDVSKQFTKAIDADVMLKGQNRFGEVSDGFVKLHGPVQEIKFYHQAEYSGLKCYFPGLAGREIEMNFRPDVPICTGDGLLETGERVPTMRRRYAEDEVDDPKLEKNAYPAVHMILMYRIDGGVRCLVLGRSLRVPGAYERLGRTSFRVKDLKQVMKQAVQSTITIV